MVDQRVIAVYFDKSRRVERLANYGLQGRQAVRLRQPDHADRRQGRRLSQRRLQAVLALVATSAASPDVVIPLAVRSLHLDAGGADHVAPALGFRRDVSGEILGRAERKREILRGQALAHVGRFERLAWPRC